MDVLDLSTMKIRPCSLKDARIFVGTHHRHNLPPRFGLFACRLVDDNEETIGVAIVDRPTARMLDDGRTAEISRCCTNGAANACSMLYGACVRACRALGFDAVITYTLQSESGASLKASNWKIDQMVDAQQSWNRPSRTRIQEDLFGNQRRPPEPKVRWRIDL